MSLRRYLLVGIIVPLVIALDQLTKYLVVERFRLGESIAVLGDVLGDFFSLTYVRNTGAAFGILQQAHPSFRIPFFIIVPIVALVAVGYIFKRVPKEDVRLTATLSLVVGGALGNLADRLHYGFVVDFLDFHWRNDYHFPAFNVADSAICVGVAFLMLDLATEREKAEHAPAAL